MICPKRLDAAVNKMGSLGIDGLLVNKIENIFYLTSVWPDNSYLLISGKKRFLITDFRFAEEIKKNTDGIQIIVLGKLGASDAIKNLCLELKIKKLGFESMSLNFFQYEILKKSLTGIKLIPTANIIEELRQIKDDAEVSAIKESASITKKAFIKLRRNIRPGFTELKLAGMAKEYLINCGAESLAFDPIVASQPGASEPHHKPKAIKIKFDSPLVVDMGGRFRGYNSDLTRTCILGKMNRKFKSLYSTVAGAQRTAIDLIRPGIKISDVDRAARQYIAGRSLGKYFGHALGHGIGLETHELPRISALNHRVFEKGMIFTVEPGVYIPGFGGVRIEDMVLVSENGCRVLTDDINE